jgi:dihydrofolate reductase
LQINRRYRPQSVKDFPDERTALGISRARDAVVIDGMKLVLIAAIGENGVIGREGNLPWRMRSDLQHFKRLTIDKPIIMGRKTYVSIGKPLDGRTNIVLTRDTSLVIPGAAVVRSLDAALDIAREDARKRGVNEIMVIGGSALFIATMEHADRLEITLVHASPVGDVVFPSIDTHDWRESARVWHKRGLHDQYDFTTITYERRH